MSYFAEYTDTYGGDPNYCWVRRCYVETAKDTRDAMRKARAELGMRGVKGDITADMGDEVHWAPRGCCTILMVRWDDTPREHRYDCPVVD